MANQINDLEWIDGMDMLHGFDTLKFKRCGKALTGPVATKLSFAGGDRLHLSIYRANRQEDLENSFQISSRASLSYSVLGGGGMKASFAKKSKVSAYTEDFVLYLQVRNAVKLVELDKINFKDSQTQKLYQANHKLFDQTYGDSFVQGALTGGEMIARFTLQADSSSTIENFLGSMNAKGGFGSVKGAIAMDMLREIKSVMKEYRFTCDLDRSGTTDNAPKLDADSVMAYALEFPSKIEENKGVPIQAILLPFAMQFPRGNPLEQLAQQQFLDDLASDRLVLLSRLNDSEFVLSHPDLFEQVNADEISGKVRKINDALNTVMKLARSCFDDSSKAQMTVLPS